MDPSLAMDSVRNRQVSKIEILISMDHQKMRKSFNLPLLNELFEVEAWGIVQSCVLTKDNISWLFFRNCSSRSVLGVVNECGTVVAGWA